VSNLAEDLRRHRAQHYSQNGEDGALARLLEIVGAASRFYVELGAGNGDECNTRRLRELGWSGIMMDCAAAGNPAIRLYREFVTAENINALLIKYGVPDDFDVLSIDLDGNDYWIWRAIAPRFQPRVVVIEYNCAVPAGIAVTMPYDAGFRWANQPNTGASLLALKKLASAQGYVLVYAEPPNAFLVRHSILPPRHRQLSLRRTERMSWREDRGRRKEWNARLRQLPWVYV
jgi:hypothetical protein